MAARWSVPVGTAATAGPWRWRDLAVVPKVVGPHARLGMAWGGLTGLALVVGPAALAALLAPVAAVAAAQAARSWRRTARRAAAPLAAGGAAAMVLAATIGPLAVGAAGAALGVVLTAGALATRDQRAADPVLTGVIAGLTGLAAAGPVLLRRDGLVAAIVLFAFAAVYDAGAYIVGTGASHVWEGTAAGLLSIGAVTLAVAAVLVPPFRGASPWVLGGLAAALAPLGPLVATALLGDRRARAPALRRLDSLLLLGPLWALAASLLVP